MSHTHALRVYYEDTDAGGVVYYANYLKYAERARTELLREKGVDQSALAAEQGVYFVVRDVQARYAAAARLDDEITVETTVEAVKKASVVMKQELSVNGAVCVAMTVTVASVALKDDGSFAPIKMPVGVF